jgi:hypothetical protein
MRWSRRRLKRRQKQGRPARTVTPGGTSRDSSDRDTHPERRLSTTPTCPPSTRSCAARAVWSGSADLVPSRRSPVQTVRRGRSNVAAERQAARADPTAPRDAHLKANFNQVQWVQEQGRAAAGADAGDSFDRLHEGSRRTVSGSVRTLSVVGWLCTQQRSTPFIERTWCHGYRLWQLRRRTGCRRSNTTETCRNGCRSAASGCRRR